MGSIVADMSDSRGQRIALNEVANRSANELILPAPEAGWDIGLVERNCECGNRACEARVRLTVAEYEELRRDGRHFAVIYEHVIPDAERVVERRPRYTVVEKVADAAAIARAHDPRR